MFTQGLDLAQAMKRAKEGDIKCQASLGDVTTYVQKFAGGKSFPLIFFLATFAKQFGNALMIGQELGQHGLQGARPAVPIHSTCSMDHHGHWQPQSHRWICQDLVQV
jgi:hypothetical protein